MTISELQERREELTARDVPVVITDKLHPLWQQGLDNEAQVFIESGYVDNAEELGGEYEKYLPKTEFIIVQQDSIAAGSVRAIFYDPEIGFKTIDDINSGKLSISEESKRLLDDIDLSNVFEIGTLAVQARYRGHADDEGRLSVALYGAIFAETKHHDCRYVLASFDERYFNSFKSIFGPAVRELGPATDYMGSPTVPALLDIPGLFEYVAETFPEMLTAATAIADETKHQ